MTGVGCRSPDTHRLGDQLHRGTQPDATPRTKSEKPPLSVGRISVITTPTLVQLNAAQGKIKSGKPKKATRRKQDLTPSTNGQVQWCVQNGIGKGTQELRPMRRNASRSGDRCVHRCGRCCYHRFDHCCFDRCCYHRSDRCCFRRFDHRCCRWRYHRL
jgi:hypothetical protein